jgi:hypothetical protein
MAAAITDLQITRTAEVSERDGIYSILSRRAKRQIAVTQERSDAGKHGAEARWGSNGKPHGKPHGKTIANTMANRMAKGMAKHGSSSSSSSSSSDYVTERSGSDPPRSAKALGMGNFGTFLATKFPKATTCHDIQFLTLIGRAVDERAIAEALVSPALAGCDGKDVKKPIAMFRAALAKNVAAAGADLDSILQNLQGGNGGSTDSNPD